MFVRLIETSEEKKHLTSVLVSNWYPYSFITNITKSKNRRASDKEPATEIKSTAVLPYVKGVSEPLHRCLQQHGVPSVFKSNTILRLHLVRPKHPVDPRKQDGVVYKIPCECSKVYVGATGRCMHERIKEHGRDIWLSRTQTSAISEHANKTGHYPRWDKVKCIDRDPHWYSRRVEEAIHRRLHPNNINRDSGIEIPESWMPTLRQHDNRPVPQRTPEGSVSSSHNANNALDRNPPSLRFLMHQSLTTMVVQIAQLSKSTLSRDEDLQCAVETSRSISKWQLWDK